MQAEQFDVFLVGAKTEGLDERVELGGVGLQVFPNHFRKSVRSVVAHLGKMLTLWTKMIKTEG